MGIGVKHVKPLLEMLLSHNRVPARVLAPLFPIQLAANESGEEKIIVQMLAFLTFPWET